MSQNISEHLRMSQNVSECLRMSHVVAVHRRNLEGVIEHEMRSRMQRVSGRQHFDSVPAGCTDQLVVVLPTLLPPRRRPNAAHRYFAIAATRSRGVPACTRQIAKAARSEARSNAAWPRSCSVAALALSCRADRCSLECASVQRHSGPQAQQSLALGPARAVGTVSYSSTYLDTYVPRYPDTG
eukprot:SAG31_NODE_467_length_15267_cov_13.792919_12_plen_183_part_00